MIFVMVICFPLLTGACISGFINKKNSDKSVNLWESYLSGFICSIGIFEVGHLSGVFLKLPVSVCGKIIVGLMTAVSIVSALFMIFRYRKRIVRRSGVDKTYLPYVPAVVFLLMLAAQICYICSTPMIQTSGDIMLETISSFMATDGIYSVSPLTGKGYSGTPMRYEVLCLPTIYTLLCEWFGIAPEMLIDNLIPSIIICVAYMAYYLLSGTLFGLGKNQTEKRLWFMVMVSVIFFMCEKMFYMEGYGILHAGHLGTTIRNSVLVPLTLYAILEKKWWLAILCMLAEACIVWTFWGFGVCAVLIAGVSLIRKLFPNCFVRRESVGE